MGSLDRFLRQMDWMGLLLVLVTAVVALFCVALHEVCHGLAAWRLGDDTAKKAGRLTLNPLRHIDPLGLLLLITVHVGWAKPVPVDMRNFKRPKRDMALTALAGPASNFAMALVSLLLASAVLRFAPGTEVWGIVLAVLGRVALLSVGMGVFNLLPLPPLDGSKIIFSLLPQQAYFTILRHERVIGVAVLIAVWSGVLNGPLTFLLSGALQGMCTVTGFPFLFFSNVF